MWYWHGDIYKKYDGTASLLLLNTFFNYGEYNPMGGAPIPVPSGVDLTSSVGGVFGSYGYKARIDVPLMMLWPTQHKGRTFTGSYLENQFYNKNGLEGD